MKCPHCGAEFEPEKGSNAKEAQKGLYISGSDLRSDQIPERDKPPFRLTAPKRGKAREYSDAFAAAWLLYGRKDEKTLAYAEWRKQAKLNGGEVELLALVKAALGWQAKAWDEQGWEFAPYFVRYLKHCRWEDEKPTYKMRRPDLSPQQQRERARSEALEREADEAVWGKRK